MVFGSSPVDSRTIIAILIAVTAIGFDVRTRKIPNMLTFGGAAAAIIFAFLQAGPWGAAFALGGWLLGAALFFPMFALGGMGAGDVKLLAALGAWLGPSDAVWLAIFTSMAGGLIALAVALSHGYLGRAFRNLWVMLMHWRVAGLRPVPGLTLSDTRAPRLAYAIPITIGVLCTLWRR